MASEFLKNKAGEQARKLQEKYGSSSPTLASKASAQSKKLREKYGNQIAAIVDAAKEEEEDIAPVYKGSGIDLLDDLGTWMTGGLKQTNVGSPYATYTFDAPTREAMQASLKERGSWFKKSEAFEDGRDMGDISLAILGTGTDIAQNVGAGLIGMGERMVDTTKQLGTWMYGGLEQNPDAIGKPYASYVMNTDKREAEKAATKAFVEKDLYDAEAIAKQIILSPYNIDAEANSVLGNKAQGLAQSAGELVGAKAVDFIAPGLGSVAMGMSAFGGELENAYSQGATFDEATASAAITAGAEVISEQMFGAIKFGGKALDDGLADVLSRNIADKALRSLAKLGIDATGEGFEEIFAEICNNLASSLYKEENLGQLLASPEALNGYIDSYIGGMALGGGVSGINIAKTNASGVDAVTGLTQNEQAVVDAIYESRKADNKDKKKSEIYDEIMQELERGELSIEEIEKVYGGTSYQEYKDLKAEEADFNRIYNTESGKLTEAEKDKLAELKAKNAATPYKQALADAWSKFSKDYEGFAKDSRLMETYNERLRRGQSFEADLNQYTGKARDVVKSAIDSGIFNNTKRSKEFVNLVAKIASDKDMDFDFATEAKIRERLKETGFALDDVRVNGYVEGGKITINMDSRKSLNSIVGHEITHVLEGSDLYTELQNTLVKYAKSKGEYDSRYKSIANLYQGKKADIDAELTADLVGDYLFSDTEFIRQLSVQNRNVFEKIYDEIKYLCKVVTAGSKEARQLEKVRKDFADIYRSTKADTSAKSAEAPQIINDSYGVIENLLSKDRVNNTLANEIIQSEKLSQAFTDITGVELEGTTEQKRQIIRNTVREYHMTEAENEALAMDAAEQAYAEDAQAKAEQAVRDSGYRSYIRGMFLKGATVADAYEILGNPDLKAEWESITGKTLPDNAKSAVKMITQTKRNAQNIDLPKLSLAPEATKNTANNGGIKFSLEKAGDIFYVQAEKNTFLKEDGTEASEREIFNSLVGKVIPFPEGDVKIVKSLPKKEMYNELIRRYPKRFNEVENVKRLNKDVNRNIEELIANSVAKTIGKPDEEGRHKEQGIISFDTRTVKFYDGEKAYNIEFSIGELSNGEKVAYAKKYFGYDAELTKKIQAAETASENSPVNQRPVSNNMIAPTKPDVKLSLSDAEYSDAVKRGDTEAAQMMVDEAAKAAMTNSKIRDKNGNLVPVYHGTQNMFYEFDTSKQGGKNGIAEGFGIYTSDSPEVTSVYGDRQIKMYANITKPATSTEKTISVTTLAKLIKDTCKRQAQQMVEDGEYDSVKDAIMDTWVSNYVYTYGVGMESAYRDVARSIAEMNDSDMDIIQEVMSGMAIRDYSEAMSFYHDSLIPITGFDGFVTHWENTNTGEKSNIILAFDSDQLKSADPVTYDDEGNVIPLSERFNTNEKDIRYSLSSVDEDIAPTGDYNVYGSDVMLESLVAPRSENIAPTSEDIAPIKATTPVAEREKPKAPAAEPAEKPPTRRGELHARIIDNIKAVFAKAGLDLDEVLRKANNLPTISTVDNTPQRVIEKTIGRKGGQILNDLTVDQVAQNETKGIRWLNSFTNRKDGILRQISKQYNIKPASKESAAAQMYAEGFYVNDNNELIAYGDTELAKDFPDAKVQENIKGLARDPRIRQIYDETLKAINESRIRNAYPEIPRLDNYFLHFRAMEDTFSRLGLPFNPNDIRAKDLPTDLNGVTADLKPGQPFFASAMHRTGKRTSYDLLGGLEKYLTSAKNQIYHIDDIQTLRALRNYIAETYGRAEGLEDLDELSSEAARERIEQVFGSHLSTFAKFLNEEANIIAGKTALIDRGLEGVIGRRGMTFLDTVNKQVGSNMVGMNISSSLTNFLPVAQAFAKTNKADFVKAFAQTVANKFRTINGEGDGFAENSPVVIRRKGAERFYRTPWQKAADIGYVFMSAVDDISTELIARTKYNELTRKGMDSQQAHIETDKWVSRLMGDRSLGQMPQIYNSKTLGLITKFQLEVRNQLDSQFYDTIQEAKESTEHIENALARNAATAAKITSTFVQLAVAQHLFGKAFEAVAGYNPAFDIIEVLMIALGFDDDEESEDTVLDNVEQGFLALLEDMPYTSALLGGGRIPISSALPIEEVVTGIDEYGNEKPRWKTLAEVAPYYGLPTGYGQIKKTVKGLSMFSDDHPIAGSYTNSGNLRYSVEDTIGNRIKAGIFGQYASKNARIYFDKSRRTLTPDQSAILKELDVPISEYWEYQDSLDEFNDVKDAMKEVADATGATAESIVQYKYLSSISSEITDLYEQQKAIAKFDTPNKQEAIRRNQERINELLEAARSGVDNVSVEGYYAEVGDRRFRYNPESRNWSEIKATTSAGEANGTYVKEQEVTKALGISSAEYWSKKEEYDYAYEHPENYALSKAVGGYEAYKGYSGALYDIKADKDANGNSIRNSRKNKVIDYINSLDTDEMTKLILYKSEYTSYDDHNVDIINYLNSRDDLSYQDIETILKQLGFKVDKSGRITW